MTEQKWCAEALAELKTAGENYKANIKAIAECVAKHDRAERVLSRDVDTAVNILDAYGHTKKAWYQRYEVEVGLGGIIFGWAASIDDMFGWLISDGYTHKIGVLTALKICCFIIGPVLMLHGVLRGRGITAIR